MYQCLYVRLLGRDLINATHFDPAWSAVTSALTAAEPRVGRGTVAVAAVGQALPILMGAHKHLVFTVIYKLLLFDLLGEQYSMNQ